MTLCLPNGERIKLNAESMRMLFEVEDLSVASPATVSRCGMVYVPEENVGWKDDLYRWMQYPLFDQFSDETKMAIQQLFEEFVPQGLRFWKEQVFFTRRCWWMTILQGDAYIPSVEHNMVSTLCAMMESLLFKTDKAKDLFQSTGQGSLQAIRMMFAFCFIWSFGGNLKEQTRMAFDAFVREAFLESIPFPGKIHASVLFLLLMLHVLDQSSVFDFYVKIDHSSTRFENWEVAVPHFAYDNRRSFSEILVPTIDTVRFSALLRMCLEVEKPVLFTGRILLSHVLHRTRRGSTGMAGAGKTAIVRTALTGTLHRCLNLWARTTSEDVQQFMEQHLEKKRKTK